MAAADVVVNKIEEEEEIETEVLRNEMLQSFWDAKAENGIDILFSFDTTGSMQGVIEEVRRRVAETVNNLMDDIHGLRIGIITHGDFCDDFKYPHKARMIQVLKFTGKKETIINHINTVPMTWGEGPSAAYEVVLQTASTMAWKPNVAKAMVLIGDVVPNAPSHTDQYINWRKMMQKLYLRGVKIYAVQAYPSGWSRPFYEELARRTGGVALDLHHFHLIPEMMRSIVYKEHSLERLAEFENSLKNSKRYHQSLAHLFKQIRGQQEAALHTYHSNWWNPDVTDRGERRYAYAKQGNVYKPFNGDYSVVPRRRGNGVIDRDEAIEQAILDTDNGDDQGGYSQRTGGSILDKTFQTEAQKKKMAENRAKLIGYTDSGYELKQAKDKPNVWVFQTKTAPSSASVQQQQERQSSSVSGDKMADLKRKKMEELTEHNKVITLSMQDPVTLTPDEELKYAIQRLTRDLKEVQRSPVYNVSALPLENNMLEWHVNLSGPLGTPYQGVIFHMIMTFPPSYPRKPPTVKICTRMMHPSVYGHWVCLDMLELGSFGDEAEQDRINTGWSSGYSVLSILLQLQAFLFTDKEDYGDDEHSGIADDPYHVTRALVSASAFNCGGCSHKPGHVWPPLPTDVLQANLGGPAQPKPKPAQKAKASPSSPTPASKSSSSSPAPASKQATTATAAVSSPALNDKKDPRAKNEVVKKEVLPLSSFTEGMEVKGIVVRVKDFGAFVDIGAEVLALLHISDMSVHKVHDVFEITEPKEEITAFIKNVDLANKKIGLTKISDPLFTAFKRQRRIPFESVKEGAKYLGQVVRLEKYGGFVDIGAYINDNGKQKRVSGLLPTKELITADRPIVWSAADVLKDTKYMWVKVAKINNQRQTIDLVIPPPDVVEVAKKDEKEQIEGAGVVVAGGDKNAKEIKAIAENGKLMEAQSGSPFCNTDMNSLYTIMSYLTPIDITRIGTTCKMMRKLADDGISFLWERNEIVCFHSKRHFTDDVLGVGVNLESKMNGKLAYITCILVLVGGGSESILSAVSDTLHHDCKMI
eukprot:TRINITY_DN3093_c2_g1_i1.p1 TRINITY_DN3093_c2_g1~~TRINITY_DN3093_c2_g1_i1.p1  ORF type:complete len:1039 (-),score=350.13 TRINITY_DN3093_c2_g1_i1:7-3123(-)